MTLLAAAVLFDVDGTLVDSTPVVERCWRIFAREYGVDAEAVLRVCHGRRGIDTVSDFIAEPERQNAAVDLLHTLELSDFDGVTALPGAAEALLTIPPTRWAAVTSGHRKLMTARLAAAQLPVPDVFVCGDDVADGKPSPVGYLMAAAALGVDPADCVVVEDAPAGVAAGCAAGSRVLAVTTTHTADRLTDADMVVADLSEVRIHLGDNQIEIAPRS